MYHANLYELTRIQMSERQQQSLAAYQVRAQQHGLQWLVAALRASIADSLRYVRTTPDPLHVAVEPAGRHVIV